MPFTGAQNQVVDGLWNNIDSGQYDGLGPNIQPIPRTYKTVILNSANIC